MHAGCTGVMEDPLQDLKEFLESEPLLDGDIQHDRNSNAAEKLLIHVYDMVYRCLALSMSHLSVHSAIRFEIQFSLAGMCSEYVAALWLLMRVPVNRIIPCAGAIQQVRPLAGAWRIPHGH